jgi:hypothetical protein
VTEDAHQQPSQAPTQAAEPGILHSCPVSGQSAPLQQAPSVQALSPAHEALQVAAEQAIPPKHASVPSQMTSQVPVLHRTPFVHASEPLQVTAQWLARPQSTPHWQAP